MVSESLSEQNPLKIRWDQVRLKIIYIPPT